MNQNKHNTKVLFIAPSAYPLGGVQTWLDYLLPGIESNGYSSALALTSGKHHNVENYLASHPIDQLEIINTQSGTIEGRVEAIENVILKVNPSIIVVVNVVDTYQAVNNLRKKQAISARIVTSIHGIQQDLFAGIRANSGLIDAVISTNRLTQKLINETSKLESKRSFYAPYGVELLDQTHSEKTKTLTIAYAGRIEEKQKRINDLLMIFSKLLTEIDDIKILIAGSGKDIGALEKWLEKEAIYSNKIDYLGVIKPENVEAEIYAKSDILLLTSEWETGPIVAWEAMNNNVCFVSSRYTGYFEEGSLIDGENCLLFDIGNIDQAVRKIHDANNNRFRSKLNANAKRLIADKYSHQKSIQTWSECFDRILQQTPKAYSSETKPNIDQSRLTSLAIRLFGKSGIRLAEKIRQIFHLKFEHQSAGSEWPHSHSNHVTSLFSLDQIIKHRDK